MLHELTKGIIKENPLFIQLLGVCPALATTSSLTNALGMGAAFTAVLISSNLIISALKKFIPANIRIPAYIVVIASLVTVTEMLMNAYVPAIYESLGTFIPLIVVTASFWAVPKPSLLKTACGLRCRTLSAWASALRWHWPLSAPAANFLAPVLCWATVWPCPAPSPYCFCFTCGAFLTMGLLFGALNYVKARREVNHGQ